MENNKIVFKITSSEHKKEDNIKEFIEKIPEGSIFYDLGANLGWFSLYAASLNLKTYAFEMDPFNFKGLEENVLGNSNIIHNINIFNKGIAGFNGKGNMLYTNEEIGGHNKVLKLDNFSGPHHQDSFNMSREIEVVTLDNFITENNLPWPDYLKIDIDGSEHSFLMGNPITLDKCKGMVIELWEGSKLYQDCVSILERYGFNMVKKYDIPGWLNGFNFVYTK